MYLTLCRPCEAKFCVFRVLLSPHKFGQRLSVLCENNFLTEVLNWRPQNESKNNNPSNACISIIYKFVI